MATKRKTQSAEVAVIKNETRLGRARERVTADVFEQLAAGVSLDQACKNVQDAPSAQTIMRWVEESPLLAEEYAHARATGYKLLADRMMTIAAETHSMVTTHAQDLDGNYIFNQDGTPLLKQVLVPLNADVLASKRLQVDTLKWQLSKMLPKIYGDKTTTELVGAGGGAVQIAAVNLKGLTDAELEVMQKLMSKAAGNGL